jgi:hypothetical protein
MVVIRAGDDWEALVRLLDLPQVDQVVYLDIQRSQAVPSLLQKLVDRAAARGIALKTTVENSENLRVEWAGRMVVIRAVEGNALMNGTRLAELVGGRAGYVYIQAPGDAGELQKNAEFNSGLVSNLAVGGMIEVKVGRAPFNYLTDLYEVIGLRFIGEKDGSRYYQKVAEVDESVVRRWLILDRTLNKLSLVSLPAGSTYRGSPREIGNQESDISEQSALQLINSLPRRLNQRKSSIISLLKLGVQYGFVPQGKGSSTASILGDRPRTVLLAAFWEWVFRIPVLNVVVYRALGRFGVLDRVLSRAFFKASGLDPSKASALGLKGWLERSGFATGRVSGRAQALSVAFGAGLILSLMSGYGFVAAALLWSVSDAYVFSSAHPGKTLKERMVLFAVEFSLSVLSLVPVALMHFGFLGPLVGAVAVPAVQEALL